MTCKRNKKMRSVVMVWVVVAMFAPTATNAAGPPAPGDGIVTGIGRDGSAGSRLFAFEAVQRDGVVTGTVSRAVVSPGTTTPVYERIGHVTCLRILDGRATMHYVIDQTNQAIAVGRVLQVYAVDGGVLEEDGVILAVLNRGRDEFPTACPKPTKGFAGLPVDGDVTIVPTD